MSTKKKRRRSTTARASSSPAFTLPAVPSLEGTAGASDRALEALEQSDEPPADDAGDETTTSPSSAPAAETANTPTPPASAAPPPATRDRSPASPAPGKSTPKAEKPKPIALEAREYKGMNTASLREQLVAEKRRNAELLERLQRESPIAQAALDEDLKTGIAETATLISEGVAFIIDEPDAKVPVTTSERLGRVWAPIAKKYLSAEMQGHLPLVTAISATMAAVIDRAAAVKEARADRRELGETRKQNAELGDMLKLRQELEAARRELAEMRQRLHALQPAA